MKLEENHTRAQKMVDSWPAWKKEVSLTKHSVQASNTVNPVSSNTRNPKGSEQVK